MPILLEDADGSVVRPAHAVARESYARCIAASDFFPSFYDFLLASDPAIPPMFARTEFPKQHRLLQHGLGLLLSYARAADAQLLERIAARHGPGGIDLHPSMYRHFESSLLQAVRQCDPGCTAEVEAAWLEAIRPGIDFMKSRHGR